MRLTKLFGALALSAIALGSLASCDNNEEKPVESEKTETTVVPAGKKEYKFGACYTYLEETEGEGFSGGSSGIGMIAMDTDGEWKTDSGYYVGYLYLTDATITFEITSDKAVNDAELKLRLSAEGKDIVLNPDNYTIDVNGTALDYADIAFFDVPQPGVVKEFNDFTVGTNVDLKEGKNIIKLISSNEESMGGTTKATAPLVDTLKITTSANLTWEPIESNLDAFA